MNPNKNADPTLGTTIIRQSVFGDVFEEAIQLGINKAQDITMVIPALFDVCALLCQNEIQSIADTWLFRIAQAAYGMKTTNVAGCYVQVLERLMSLVKEDGSGLQLTSLTAAEYRAVLIEYARDRKTSVTIVHNLHDGAEPNVPFCDALKNYIDALLQRHQVPTVDVSKCGERDYLDALMGRHKVDSPDLSNGVKRARHVRSIVRSAVQLLENYHEQLPVVLDEAIGLMLPVKALYPLLYEYLLHGF
jgi:hypothetical protein